MARESDPVSVSVGQLSAEGVERALRAAIKREAAQKLLDIGRSMRGDIVPPMTEEEIQAEIDAYRAERRAKRDAAGT